MAEETSAANSGGGGFDVQKTPVDNVSEYASALGGDDEDFKDAMLFEEKDNPLGDETEPTESMLYPNMVDIDSMKDAVFFLFEDRSQRLSRFWILIVCAAIIATMGVAGDSSATVIGAMIVAPLMTPIMGTMLSIVLTDGPNFLLSMTLVITGGGCALFIGYVLGSFLDPDSISSENNSQVAGRVEPKLTDLVGALATGAVGSIALVRKDIADTLPGVAIAISLVPPLCVAGLTLSTGATDDAAGAVLLFATNFASILVIGVIVMYFYKVQLRAKRARARLRGTAICMVFLLLAFITVPLTLTSLRLREILNIQDCVKAQVDEWGEPYGWSTQVVVARAKGNRYEATVAITGPPPFPDENEIPSSDCGVDSAEISFLPAKTIMLTAEDED